MAHLASRIDDLLLIRRRDEALVVETLVDEYYIFIYRLAVSILNDPHEAEDATQETIIAAMDNLDRYQVKTNFRGWLYTIAVNTCRSHLRKRKRRQAYYAMWDALQSMKNNRPTPEETALKTEAGSQLWAAVSALGEKHRLPVILRFVHSLPIKEIAAILEISEGTVHSRLHYAVRKLQKHFKRYGLDLDDIREAYS